MVTGKVRTWWTPGEAEDIASCMAAGAGVPAASAAKGKSAQVCDSVDGILLWVYAMETPPYVLE